MLWLSMVIYLFIYKLFFIQYFNIWVQHFYSVCLFSKLILQKKKTSETVKKCCFSAFTLLFGIKYIIVTFFILELAYILKTSWTLHNLLQEHFLAQIIYLQMKNIFTCTHTPTYTH